MKSPDPYAHFPSRESESQIPPPPLGATWSMRPGPSVAAPASKNQSNSLDELERRALEGDTHAADILRARVKTAIRGACDPLLRELEKYIIYLPVFAQCGEATAPQVIEIRRLPPHTAQSARRWAVVIFDYAAHDGNDLSRYTSDYTRQKLAARKKTKMKLLEKRKEAFRASHKSGNLPPDEKKEIESRRARIEATKMSASDQRRGAIDAITSKLKTLHKILQRKYAPA